MKSTVRALSLGASLAIVSVAAPSAMALDPIWSGEWFGAYKCGQGVTQMTLNIEAESDGRMSARFDFSSPSTSESLPSWTPLGSFSMEGNFTGDNFRLKATSWIKQAYGYSPVDLSGSMVSAGEIQASVSGCGSITMRRWQ